jgi:(E)-4-hydroxy-3-methylbut-2-enyl-diphosphate synthase
MQIHTYKYKINTKIDKKAKTTCLKLKVVNMSYSRKKTREVSVGNVKIGGDNPISVQSMTNTDTRDAKATIEQIKRLEEAGCDLVRVAVPDMVAAKAIGEIKSKVSIPVIADIHFDYKLALEAIDQGVDGVRINPGNIGDVSRVKMVVDKCKEKNLKIRIGVNGGSLEKELLEKYGSATSEALVESAMGHIKILEDLDFYNTVISLKSSDIFKTIDAYRLISEKVDYPLHVGITESGSIKKGTIKSSIGVGALLVEGIGDTIRISLTGDPVEEVNVGKEILRSLGLLNDKIKVVSCPTCGRCNIDLISVVNDVEKKIADLDKDITVAIMGCAVNGPGEAREADVGIAGGKGEGLLFKKGEIVRKIKDSDLVEELLDEIDRL